MKPLVFDLYCGLGGWAEGFLAEGYDVIGFDIEVRPYPGQLVIQDVRTLHGAQFRDATVIVASPPCQEYSYRAMPWKRAKALPAPSNELFDVCFRIQREACEAAGRYIPMVVENVCGAQKWVGRAKWHYGSYYLWGDVPALMPLTKAGAVKRPGMNWNGSDKPGYKAEAFNGRHRKQDGYPGLFYDNYEGSARRFSSKSTQRKEWSAKIAKVPVYSDPRRNGGKGVHLTSPWENSDGLKFGGRWWHDSTNNLIRKASSKSHARKIASALIAKIPFPLARHIANVFKNDVLPLGN